MKVLPFCALSCAGIALMAQQGNQPKPPVTPVDQEGQTTITLDVTRVNILFTVTDKKGRFVTDLGKDDFSVVEAKKPQVIQQFTAESDLPLRLAVLIDTSNSIRDEFRFEQEAAVRFMQSVMRPREDRMLLVSFDSAAELVTDLTGDLKKLDMGINGIRPGGGTSLYDAGYFASKEKLMMDQPRDKFRRAMIVISDGEDTSSRGTREIKRWRWRKRQTWSFTRSQPTPSGTTWTAMKVLRYLTEETGGQAFFPFKVEDLDQSFENIANELRRQYNIFYRPEPLKADGLYHAINVKVRTRKDLVVRARKGYYAPKF